MVNICLRLLELIIKIHKIKVYTEHILIDITFGIFYNYYAKQPNGSCFSTINGIFR